jgi:hypothetical protein
VMNWLYIGKMKNYFFHINSVGSERCFTPGFLANIRLGLKGLPGTNSKAYYEHSKITAVKLCYDIWFRS